jgi:hypothetical protein
VDEALEILRNLERTQEYRQALNLLSNRKKSKNLAFADTTIEGIDSSSLKPALSGEYSPPGTTSMPDGERFFTTITDKYPREFDSEVKLLENIAQQYVNLPGVVKDGDQYRGISGSIDLFTERAPCQSCADVIQQFRQMFPDLEINYTSGPPSG